MNEHDPSAWLASIVEIFDDLRLEWTLIGALAANRYRSTPRFTTDLDTLVAAHPDLVGRLQEAGYEVTASADPGEAPHLLRCRRGPTLVDILHPVVAYQREALGRAVDHVLRPEDVIIHKLIAWRVRDRDDIRSMLEAEVVLDETYLDRWVRAWEIDERWATFPR